MVSWDLHECFLHNGDHMLSCITRFIVYVYVVRETPPSHPRKGSMLALGPLVLLSSHLAILAPSTELSACARLRLRTVTTSQFQNLRFVRASHRKSLG